MGASCNGCYGQEAEKYTDLEIENSNGKGPEVILKLDSQRFLNDSSRDLTNDSPEKQKLFQGHLPEQQNNGRSNQNKNEVNVQSNRVSKSEKFTSSLQQINETPGEYDNTTQQNRASNQFIQSQNFDLQSQKSSQLLQIDQQLMKLLDESMDKNVVELAKAYISIQNDDYLFGNQIVVRDKEGQIDYEKSFKIIQLPLKNTSDFSMGHPLFDSHSVIDAFKVKHQRFASNYTYNGVWKQLDDTQQLASLKEQLAASSVQAKTFSKFQEEIVLATFYRVSWKKVAQTLIQKINQK